MGYTIGIRHPVDSRAICNSEPRADTPGTIVITNPTGGENWFTGNTYELTADAVDADGIAGVDFFWGDVLFGYIGTASLVLGSTWHFLWTPDSQGTDLPVIAVLTDNNGHTTVSADVLITVNIPG